MDGSNAYQQEGSFCSYTNLMRIDPQTLEIKDNKENNHNKDASFGFNVNQ